MGFAVLHSEKGTSSPTQLGKHIDRAEGVGYTHTHADPTIKNIDLTEDKWKERPLHECVNERIAEGYTGKTAIRKDAVKYLTHILSGSHEEMKKIEASGRLNEWIEANKKFIEKEFGKENIIRFSVHLDEKTPHIHAVTVPLTADGRLSGKEIFGNKIQLSTRQDQYAEAMKNFALDRGIKNTGIKHESAREYYGRLQTIEKSKDQVIEKLNTILEDNKFSRFDVLNVDKKNEAIRGVLSDFVKKEIQDTGKQIINENSQLKSQIKAIQKGVEYAKLAERAVMIKSEVPIIDYFANLADRKELVFEGKKGNEFYFATPSQKTGSIAVNPSKNVYFDHSEGKGGDVFKAIQQFEKIGFSEAVITYSSNYENLKSNAQRFQTERVELKNEENQTASVTCVLDKIEHPALINYVKERGLSEVNTSLLKQIHWEVGDKSYFGIGVKNSQGGYDVRNAGFKGKIGPNGITIKSYGDMAKQDKTYVFEGFTDYLSFRKLTKEQDYKFVILNSTANAEKAIPHLKKGNVCLMLDNDNAGNEATTKLKNALPNAVDLRHTYTGKDLNESLLTQIAAKNERRIDPGMRR